MANRVLQISVRRPGVPLPFPVFLELSKPADHVEVTVSTMLGRQNGFITVADLEALHHTIGALLADIRRAG